MRGAISAEDQIQSAEPAATGLAVGTAAIQTALGRFRAESPTAAQPTRLRQQLEALVLPVFRDDPNLPAAIKLIDSLFSGTALELSSLALSGRDRLFAFNLQSLQQRIFSSPNERGEPIRLTDRNEDCLADDEEEWSVFRALNLAFMASLPATRKVAIVTSIRNEGLSILEWLAHHRSLGFEAFYIYTNDNTDESDGLLRTLASHGIINLIDNDVGPGVKVQSKVLEHSLQLLPELRDFEWAFYIDVDEFFISRCGPELTLASYMENFDQSFPDDKPSAVAFNWKWFGSENAFEMTDGLLMERFVHSIDNDHVKSLIRLPDAVSMRRVHVPDLVEGAWLVNSNFSRVDPSIHMRPTYGKGQLNHYWNKSFQEFMLKRNRGRISAGFGGAPLDVSSFFDWGANGRRGNFDPPQERVLNRMKNEYSILRAISNVDDNLATIRRHCAETLASIDLEMNLEGLYERRGRSSQVQ